MNHLSRFGVEKCDRIEEVPDHQKLFAILSEEQRLDLSV